MLTVAAQVLASAQVPPPSAPLSLPTYIAELDRLATFLSNATPGEAEAISSSIAPRWLVDTGTARVAVDTRWLVAGLREATDSGNDWNAGRGRLRRRLLALRAHATEAAAAAPGSLHTSLRSAVDEVLAGPEFQQSAAARWREQLQQQFGEWVESLLGRIGVSGIAGRSLAVAFAWVAGIAALGGLGIWLARVLAAGSRAVSFGLSHGERRRLSAREWALRAGTALHDGDAREAVRCAYNAALRRMEEEGVWRLDQSRTPREYLRMLRPNDNRGPAVKELTELFEQVWYGNRGIDGADMTRVSGNLEKLGCLHPADRAI